MSHHHYHHRNPKALLTPAMHGVLERMARAGHVPLHALTPTQARAAYAAGADVLELPPHPLERQLINEPLVTNVRALDGMLLGDAIALLARLARRAH